MFVQKFEILYIVHSFFGKFRFFRITMYLRYYDRYRFALASTAKITKISQFILTAEDWKNFKILKIGMRTSPRSARIILKQTFTTQHITKKQYYKGKKIKGRHRYRTHATTFGLQTRHSIHFAMDALTNFDKLNL